MFEMGWIQNGLVLDEKHWVPKTRKEEGKPLHIRYFDKEGELILEPDEKLVSITDNIELTVLSDWKVSNSRNKGKPIFKGYLGSGKVIITTNYLIHLRQPDPYKIGMEYGGYSGQVSGWAETIKAKLAKKEDINEYIRFSLNDIVSIELLDRIIDLFLIINNKRFLVRGYYNNKETANESLISITKMLKQNEISRHYKKQQLFIHYNELAKYSAKQFWKQEDIVKKAKSFEQKQMPKKAYSLYKKALAIIPEDERVRAKVAKYERMLGK